MTLELADGRGELFQWDTGRRLRVGSGVEQIHYQNKCFGRSVDVDVGTDGTAIIPDELLQDWHPLTAYAYVTDDTGAYTMVQQDFAVHKREARRVCIHPDGPDDTADDPAPDRRPCRPDDGGKGKSRRGHQ